MNKIIRDLLKWLGSERLPHVKKMLKIKIEIFANRNNTADVYLLQAR